MSFYTAIYRSELNHVLKNGYGEKLQPNKGYSNLGKNYLFESTDKAISFCKSRRNTETYPNDGIIVLHLDDMTFDGKVSQLKNGYYATDNSIPASKLFVETPHLGRVGLLSNLKIIPAYCGEDDALRFVIALVLGEHDEVVGHKVIDLLTQKTDVVNLNKFKACEDYSIRNFRMLSGQKQASDINGEELNYPILYKSDSRKNKNSIVILYQSGEDKYLVTDGTARLREVTGDQIRGCNQKQIANLASFQSLMTPDTLRSFRNKGAQEISDIDFSSNQTQDSIIYKRELYKDHTQFESSTPDKWSFAVGAKISIDQIVNSLYRYDPNVGDEPERQELSAPSAEDGFDSQPHNTDIIEDTTPIGTHGNGEYKILTRQDGGRIVATGISPFDYAEDVVLPHGITHIGKAAFKSSKFKRCKLPETVVYLEEQSFANSELEVLELTPSISAIPHYCFYRSNLRKIDLSGIKSIGNYSFTHTLLTDVTLNPEVLQIGMGAFSSCRELTSVKHSTKLRKIRSKAFYMCTSLSDFDFDGISEVETEAFNGVNLQNIKLSGDVTYIQSFTFVSPVLASVTLEDGAYKVADRAFVSEQPIVYTLPKSLSNIGVSLINEQDTVRCYHNTIAESSAKLAKCTIEYLDEAGQYSKSILKASMVGMDIPTLIKNTIKSAYTKDDVDYDYEIDPACNLVNIPLSQEQLNFLGIEAVETPEGYTEKSKFKVLLEHYGRVCQLDGIGLSSIVFAIKNTISVNHETIYDDGISRVYEFLYYDHKYESKKAKYIIAMTGNNVRYCCLNNNRTDVYCKTQYSKDLTQLLNLLCPGDTIGYDCTIAGNHYDGIATTAEGMLSKDKEPISLNIYQALFNCSITIKLEKNHLAIILPVNGKILKCASLGKAVWNNENDESYKAKYCVIEDIQDLKTNTILGYDEQHQTRDNTLLELIRSMSAADITNRLREYSHIGKSELSPYYSFQQYCEDNDIDSIESLDLRGLGYLLAFPILEQRSERWMDQNVGKTIVNAAKDTFNLKDGTIVKQYKTVKRIATYNKLITGGDRTLYVFEVYYRNARVLITSSMLDLDHLFEMGIEMVMHNSSLATHPDIYQNPDEFDVVSPTDMIILAEAFVNKQERRRDDRVTSSIYLCVYKPNGRYYLSYISKSAKIAIPIIQVGDFEVALDYIDCATTKTTNEYATIMDVVNKVYADVRSSGISSYYRRRLEPSKRYYSMLEARKLCIEGVTDMARYRVTGLSPVLCHMLGVINPIDNPELSIQEVSQSLSSNNPGKAQDIEFSDDEEYFTLEEDGQGDPADIDIDSGDTIDTGDDDDMFDDLDTSDLEVYGENTSNEDEPTTFDEDATDDDLDAQAAYLRGLL